MSTSSARTLPPAAPRAPRPARKRAATVFRRGTAMVLVAVAAALVALVGWIHSADFQRRAVTVLDKLVEDLTGELCTVTYVGLQLWPPALEVNGFHLHHAATGDTILSAERVRVPVVLRDGGPNIGRLALQRPVLQLHLEPDGKLREFRGLTPRDPSAPRAPLKRLPWSSLEVTDGALRLELPDGHVYVEHVMVLPVYGRTAELLADVDLRYRGFEERTRLEIPNLVLGPDRIEIPALAIDSRPLDVQGRVNVPLGGELDIDLTAQVELDRLTPLLTAPRALHGFVDLDLRLEGAQSSPRARLAVFGRDLGFDAPGVHTPLLTYELGDVAASVLADPQALVIEKATAYVGDEGELSVWGTIDLPTKRLVDSRVVASRVSLAHLLRSFDAAPTPWVDMSTDLEVAWEGSLQPLRLEGPFDLSVATLQVGDRPIDARGVELMLDIPRAYAQGRLVLEKDHIELHAPTIVGPRNRGSADIDIGFGPKGPLDLQADLHHADLRDFQPLNGVEMTGSGRVTGRIHGPFNQLRLEGRGDLQDFSVLGIPYADRLQATLVSPDMKSIELHDAQALRRTTPYTGDFRMSFQPPIAMDTDVVIGSGRVEDLVSMFVDLPGMTGALEGGTLSLHGPLYDLDGGAHLELGASDLWGERFSDGAAHGYMDQGVFTLDDLRVLRHEAQEGLLLRGSVDRKWALDMELVADGLALERLDWLAGTEALSGAVVGHSRITGTLFDPSPDGRIDVTDVRFAGNAVADSVVRFDTTDGVMRYTGDLLGGTAKVDGTLGLWGEQAYVLHADLDGVPAHTLYPIAADGSPLRAIASGDIDISGHFGEVWSPVTLRAELPQVEVQYGPHVLRNAEPWLYDQDGNTYRLTNFNLAGGATHLTLSASGGDTLDLRGDGTVDLDLLRAVVPGLERSTGLATVRLDAVGAKPNVEAVVEVDVDAELLRYASIPVAFEDLRADVRVTDARIELASVRANVGGGTMAGAGVIDTERWVPTRWDLQADIEDAQVQWVETLPPAIGDAKLRFDGPVDALLLHGAVTVEDMTFSDRIDWEDWVVEYREEMLVDPATLYDEEPYFSLDVGIEADRTIHLRNNVAEGTASADLRIIGDTTRPGLVGTVDVEESVVFLQDREFRVDRGNLLFNDPWTWDPEVDFALVTDIENQDQRYRVNYLVMGPFSDWRSTTRSDPALPQADVNALLWFGVTTEELEESGELSSAVAQSMADLILTDFFITNQAGELTDDLPEFLFDRIDLATGVNGRGEYSPEPRLLVEKRLTELGDVDLRWEFNLVRPEDNYVRADKRIGGIWSLSGWYASLQRDRVLPIGGAYGVDVTARWETE